MKTFIAQIITIAFICGTVLAADVDKPKTLYRDNVLKITLKGGGTCHSKLQDSNGSKNYSVDCYPESKSGKRRQCNFDYSAVYGATKFSIAEYADGTVRNPSLFKSPGKKTAQSNSPNTPQIVVPEYSRNEAFIAKSAQEYMDKYCNADVPLKTTLYEEWGYKINGMDCQYSTQATKGQYFSSIGVTCYHNVGGKRTTQCNFDGRNTIIDNAPGDKQFTFDFKPSGDLKPTTKPDMPAKTRYRITSKLDVNIKTYQNRPDGTEEQIHETSKEIPIDFATEFDVKRTAEKWMKENCKPISAQKIEDRPAPEYKREVYPDDLMKGKGVR
jgi:hypothetical protein